MLTDMEVWRLANDDSVGNLRSDCILSRNRHAERMKTFAEEYVCSYHQRIDAEEQVGKAVSVSCGGTTSSQVRLVTG